MLTYYIVFFNIEEFKISDMDDWMLSDEDSSEEGEGEDEEAKEKKATKKKRKFLFSCT